MTPLFPAWFQVTFGVAVAVSGGAAVTFGVWQWVGPRVAGWFQQVFDEDEAVWIENEERA